MARTISLLATSTPLVLALAVACGGGEGEEAGADASGSGSAADAGSDGGGADASAGGDVDASAGPDAGAAPDASAGSEVSALGRPCTGAGQGDCPDGYDCIPGASGPWCTFRCEDQDDTSCEEGYDGPGHPACILTVTINEETFRACSVVCDVEEESFEDELCPSDNCDGTCPGELACEGAINDVDDGDRVGSTCT